MTAAGYRPDERHFTPHVTLGRIRQERRQAPVIDLTELLGSRTNWSAPPFRVTEIVTFASTLAPEGPHYVQLASAPLRGKKLEQHLDRNRNTK